MKVVINSAQNLVVLCKNCENIDTTNSEIAIQTVNTVKELLEVLKEFREYEVEVWNEEEINQHLKIWLG